MKQLTAIAVSLSCLLLCCSSFSPFDAELDSEWSNYKVKFQRKYEGIEEQGRRLIWEQNVLKINKHNLEADMGMHTYWMGVNQFSDMTEEEWDKMRNCSLSHHITVKHHRNTYPRKEASSSLPDAVDWRDKGWVTNVKNQGNCGSCWAFSTTGTLEGQVKNVTGKLVSLSEQNLVDCAWSYGNYGCNGGWMLFALYYVYGNGGIDTEESYPYRGNDGDCQFNPSTVGAKITDYTAWLSGTEDDLQDAVANVGPISVAITANNNFMQYKSGIFYDPGCASVLNHGVLAAGYGKQDNDEYWIVKNSWGETWGENGYIRMARNRGNICGIASFPAYPIM